MTAPQSSSSGSTTLADYFNPLRLKIAAYLEARDEEDINKPISQHLIDWATQNIKVGMGAEHKGDCTKESHSCMRCAADRALAQADEVLAIVGAAQGSPARGDVTLNEDQAYHLFLIADTAARNDRGKNRAVNHLRELLLPAYRAWHDANPGTAHPALSLPSTDHEGGK